MREISLQTTKPILCYVKGEKINEMVMSGSPIHDFIESSPPYKISSSMDTIECRKRIPY